MAACLKILCVGRVKEKFFREGIDHYVKKISPRCRIEIIECPDEPTPDRASARDEEKILQIEGERILSKITRDDRVIALCIDGKCYSSPQLSKLIHRELANAQGTLCLVIGGSLGLAPAVISRADHRLSFSAMTFPHQMMRLILLEQLDRCL